MKTRKRVFGYVELMFDLLYLLAALVIALVLLLKQKASWQSLAGIMGLVLVGGDSFHLVPRMGLIVTQQEKAFVKWLGVGKLITSITMTVFYVLLWHVGLKAFGLVAPPFGTGFVYALAGLRIILCLFPQNGWLKHKPPLKWSLFRNIPFVFLGLLVMGLFMNYWNLAPWFKWMGLAIGLSFTFYLPVVFGANKNPKLGMLMLPKSLMYIWILAMCLGG